MQSPNISDLIGSLQNQILGLQTHALQQSMLNSNKISNAPTKVNSHHGCKMLKSAARLCNLYTLSIALKSASYLESKEICSGKQLVWPSLKSI